MAVIRNISVLFAVFWFGFCAFVAEVHADTYKAASCSYSDVSAAVSAAGSGDTVSVPSGSCAWDSTLTINKGLTLQGAGIDSTNISCSTCAQAAFIIYSPDSTALSNNAVFEVSGFTFDGHANSTIDGIDLVNPNATAIKNIKIHHNRFYRVHRAVDVAGNVYGVVYLNTMAVNVDGAISYPMGNEEESWNGHPASFGTGNNLYFEDNTMTGWCWMGAGQGGRYAFRYNTCTDMVTGGQGLFDMHGNQGSGIHATMMTEVYGNNFVNNASGSSVDMRGGQHLFFFNKVTGPTNWTWQIREEYHDGYSYGAVTNICPANKPQICLDSCQCMKINHTYIWNNRKSGTLLDATITEDDYIRSDGIANSPPELVENREFWQQGSSFNGTSGVGCGTLASRPTTCTTGVGYWATDQSCSSVDDANVGANPAAPISGTLYRCTAPNTWTPYYTPYTYPHPLRTTTLGAPALAAPGNLRIVQ